MSITPGEAGSAFQVDALTTVQQVVGAGHDVGLDGGVTREIAPRALDAGASGWFRHRPRRERGPAGLAVGGTRDGDRPSGLPRRVPMTAARPGRRSVPLAQVAAEAGVSVPTVSKVLNARPDVSAATRERVAGVLRRHGSIHPSGTPSCRGPEISAELSEWGRRE